MPATLESVYASNPNDYTWLKGNLHTHTTLSDGSRDPQTVIDLYKALQHDFMALTDHDIFSDYSKLDSRGLIFLPGVEVTAKGQHILQIGGHERAEPVPDRQAVIENIRRNHALAIVNHPNWQTHWNHCSLDLMQSWQGYVGMEIFNGVCLDLEGSHLAVDKWERLLTAGRKVWAFANDDSHHARHEGRGWNMVQVPRHEVTPEGIMAALRAGRFYPSTGVTIDTMEVTGGELHVAAKNADAIEIYGEHGRRHAYTDTGEIRFDAGNLNSLYIRAQCYGKGSAMAWTQPFLLHTGEIDERREKLAAAKQETEPAA